MSIFLFFRHFLYDFSKMIVFYKKMYFKLGARAPLIPNELATNSIIGHTFPLIAVN